MTLELNGLTALGSVTPSIFDGFLKKLRGLGKGNSAHHLGSPWDPWIQGPEGGGMLYLGSLVALVLEPMMMWGSFRWERLFKGRISWPGRVYGFFCIFCHKNLWLEDEGWGCENFEG